MTTLLLTPARIIEEMFTGGFKPMNETDYMAYCDAEKGSLIANIEVGRVNYTVLFTPSIGEVEISGNDSTAWIMNVNTGDIIPL